MGDNEGREQEKEGASPEVTAVNVPPAKPQLDDGDDDEEKPPAKKARSEATETGPEEAQDGPRNGGASGLAHVQTTVSPATIAPRPVHKLAPVPILPMPGVRYTPNPPPNDGVPWEFAHKPYLRGAKETYEQFIEAKYNWQFVVAMAVGIPKYKGVLTSPVLLSAARTRLWKPKTIVLVREVLRRSYFLELEQVTRRFEDTSFRKPRPHHWNRERLMEWLEHPINNSLWKKDDIDFIDERMTKLFKELQPVSYADKPKALPAMQPVATNLESDAPQTLKVAVPQLAPCWFNRAGSIHRVLATIEIAAAKQKADLIVFPEAIVPGYPYWLSEDSKLTSDQRKELYLRYSSQAVTIEEGHLATICHQLKTCKMACYLGIVERPLDRHSLYASMVYINKQGVVLSVHRKLCPSQHESHAISAGDGNGLVAHKLGGFTVGGLNSWENWMPLTRAALYAQAEDIHVASWPGNKDMTKDITRMIAMEGRSYVISVGALMRPEDVSDDTPYANQIRESVAKGNYDGGCCVAAPDGTWVLPLEPGVQSLRYCMLDPALVREERRDFDPTGQTSRPDVTQLTVHRKRQNMAKFED